MIGVYKPFEGILQQYVQYINNANLEKILWLLYVESVEILPTEIFFKCFQTVKES